MTASKLMSRAEQAEQTRQLVLTTAQRLFAEHGFDATSLQMIADDMGVQKSNVYYYFRTKAEILTAISLPAMKRLDAVLDAAASIRTKRERIHALITGYVDVLVSSRGVSALAARDPAVSRQSDIAEFSKILSDKGLRVLFGENPTPDGLVAFYFINSLSGIIPSFGQLSDDDLRALLIRNCYHVLRTRP